MIESCVTLGYSFDLRSIAKQTNQRAVSLYLEERFSITSCKL